MHRLSWSQLVYVCLIVTALALLSAPGAQAAPVLVTSYDMMNGTTGSYNYRDFTYLPDPSSLANVSFSSLSGGSGKLTDGSIPANHWNNYGDLTPYVGWVNVVPTITFHFTGSVNVNQVGIYLDNTPNVGDVRYPAGVVIKMGAVTDSFSISPDSNWDAKWFYFPTPGLSGNTLELTLSPISGKWMMLGEVSFDGAAAPLPPGLLLVGTGLVALGGWSRFRKG